MNIYFTDYFDVDPDVLEEYGALNISLVNDLPLFIDPFLLFASQKPEYRQLHEEMIAYLKFLRDQSVSGGTGGGLLKAWYMFPEVKQLWLGFSLHGNAGSGLGHGFGQALNANLKAIFTDFGNEKVTQGTHMEKVCLVADGVGRDNISDFTANLIKPFLCEYTQRFAREHMAPMQRRRVSVDKASFDYRLQRWMPRDYELPYYRGDYVLLTPKDMLSKDENWINRTDLVDELETIARAVPDEQLRSELSNYLSVRLREDMTDKERKSVRSRAISEYPQVIEYYILRKEQDKDEAIRRSDVWVRESEEFYIHALACLSEKLFRETGFYQIGKDTLEEARARVMYLKQVIENNDGYRLFYREGRPIQKESDLGILYRLTWYATPSDFNSEVNNGRGSVDFKISRGSKDSTLVEFKLAKNSKLGQNLQSQVEVYKAANKTEKTLKVVFYFSAQELDRVRKILEQLGLSDDDTIILIDVRNDNKPSASNAKQ